MDGSGIGRPSSASPLEVQRDGLADEPLDLRLRFARGDASRQVRHVSRQVRPRVLDDDRVTLHPTPASSPQPACRVMPLSISGGTVWLGLPETVTRPDLVRCLNCRCPPFRFDLEPAVVEESPEHFADLHAARLQGREVISQAGDLREGWFLPHNVKLSGPARQEKPVTDQDTPRRAKSAAERGWAPAAPPEDRGNEDVTPATRPTAHERP